MKRPLGFPKIPGVCLYLHVKLAVSLGGLAAHGCTEAVLEGPQLPSRTTTTYHENGAIPPLAGGVVSVTDVPSSYRTVRTGSVTSMPFAT